MKSALFVELSSCREYGDVIKRVIQERLNLNQFSVVECLTYLALTGSAHDRPPSR